MFSNDCYCTLKFFIEMEQVNSYKFNTVDVSTIQV